MQEEEAGRRQVEEEEVGVKGFEAEEEEVVEQQTLGEVVEEM